MRNFLTSTHSPFWEQHPALLYAITLLIGVTASLFWEFPWNLFFLLLWIGYLIALKRWRVLFLLPAISLYCFFLYANAPQLKQLQEIEAMFSISSLQPHQSPFQKGVIYKGTLFLPETKIPCSMYLQGRDVPPANFDYWVEGTLEQRGHFDYTLKPRQWIPIKKSWSLAHWRYLVKERYRAFLEKKFTQRVADFFVALSVGDLENRLLKYEFEHLGLQHILGVSGFHFIALIAFFSFLFSLFLPRTWKLLVLLTLVNAYYLFIGPFPAVQRCWLTASVYLISRLIKRRTSGLNLLGFALGAEVICNPLIVSNIGFQLSFSSCIGILLLHSPIEKRLRILLPKRSASDIAALSLFSKHGYILSNFVRQAFSLTMAVNIMILPILLVHFHFFPLLSLFYNLFFPFFADAILFLLLLSLALHLLTPSLASFLFSATDWLTQYLLDLASYPPIALDYPFFCSHLPTWLIPCWIFFLFALSIHATEKKFHYLTNRRRSS